MLVGITECGDAGLNFAWESKINKYLFNILITKNLNDSFIGKVINLNNVIIHATITGYGGTEIEPNVPIPEWSFSQLSKLIEEGFPLERIVVRIDPMFTNPLGQHKALLMINKADKLGIKRIRYSYADLFYNHVKERYNRAGIPIPYGSNHFMLGIIPKYPNIKFESCAEGINTDIGCISEYDYTLFGFKPETELINGQQRNNCKCLAVKVELLTKRKRCPHGCLYCYWRD